MYRKIYFIFIFFFFFYIFLIKEKISREIYLEVGKKRQNRKILKSSSGAKNRALKERNMVFFSTHGKKS